jgi:hypothetical protein
MTNDNPVENDIERLVERPEVEFLILADHAEAVNGKLYLMGGGWDRRAVADFRQLQIFAVAVAVLIPWTETNRPLPLTVSLTDLDGAPVAPPLQTQLTAGRPANAKPGQKLRYMLAVNFQTGIPRPGEYVVEARIGQSPPKRVSFYAEPINPGPGGEELH